MSEVNNIGAYNSLYNAAGSTAGSQAKQAGSMTMEDFYKVLAAEMKYQDADNPMDTSQMLAQMVQTQMIQAISDMSTVNTITYASSMIGKEVTMAEVDATMRFTGETTTGTVTGILLGDNPALFIGEKRYYLAQLMTVGEVPVTKPDPDEGTGGDDSENTGKNNGTGGDDAGSTAV